MRPRGEPVAERSQTRYGDGIRVALPFAVAVAAFGVSFGVLAEAAGVGGTASIVMSATTFAGAAQFAAVSVLGAGGGVAAAVGAAVLLNARYAPMGLAAARVFRGGRIRRLAESQLVVDEAWALSRRDKGFDRHLLVGAGLTLYASWVGGTALGVAAGGAVGDPAALGLDAAFPALFLALLVTQVHDFTGVVAALGGAAIALALIPLAPAGVPIIAATLACLVGASRSASPGDGARDRRDRAR